jgi:hypothetical protein
VDSRKLSRRDRQRAEGRDSQIWQAAGREEGRLAWTLMVNRRGGGGE